MDGLKVRPLCVISRLLIDLVLYTGRVMSIDMLPDDVLVEIFDFCSLDIDQWWHTWQTLVHVCRQWRHVVFGSPRRLNLQLVCSALTPTRDMLNIWPPLPLLVYADLLETTGVDNVVAALEHSDRVREISITISPLSQWEELWKGMEEPLPELTFLHLDFEHEPVLILPDSFLGGYAPRLQSLELNYVPFPGLPKLLLSATNLAELSLSAIPPFGYISPEAMVTGLSALTHLERLYLGFESSLPCPDRQSRRFPTRRVLPALTRFKFHGASAYLDDLVARIDVPRLDDFSIIFFDLLDLDTGAPHLVQFISRTPYSKAFGKAHITFHIGHAVMVNLSPQTFGRGELNLARLSEIPEWHMSSLTQVCTSCLPSLPSLEDLYIHGELFMDWQGFIEDHQWPGLLRPFIYVKNLYVSMEFVPSIVSALQELVGDQTTEILPILQNILLEGRRPSGHIQKRIEQFVAARQLTGHPTTVSFRDSIPKQDRYSELFLL